MDGEIIMFYDMCYIVRVVCSDRVEIMQLKMTGEGRSYCSVGSSLELKVCD